MPAASSTGTAEGTKNPIWQARQRIGLMPAVMCSWQPACADVYAANGRAGSRHAAERGHDCRQLAHQYALVQLGGMAPDQPYECWSVRFCLKAALLILFRLPPRPGALAAGPRGAAGRQGNSSIRHILLWHGHAGGKFLHSSGCPAVFPGLSNQGPPGLLLSRIHACCNPPQMLTWELPWSGNCNYFQVNAELALGGAGHEYLAGIELISAGTALLASGAGIVTAPCCALALLNLPLHALCWTLPAAPGGQKSGGR